MRRSGAAVLLALLPQLTLTGLGQSAERALYEAKLPANAHPKQIARLEIATSPGPEPDLGNWYHLTAAKVNGDTFDVWFLANGGPFSLPGHGDVAIHRYVLQEPNQPPTEYIDRRTGDALVPLFDFVEKLLPHGETTPGRALFDRGTYLGHPLLRTRTLEPKTAAPPPVLRKLVLRNDLIVGTSRNFRDDGKGRKDKKSNFNYIPFTRDDYDEMIAAGINYFTAKGEQVDWICHRPVFYDGYSPSIAFPEELYRPNFLGLHMFIDEPACRLAGKYPRGASLQQAVEMIHEHIRERIDSPRYHELLTRSGIDLGSLELPEPAIPIWETYIETSYYQLEANPCGIVQECRWRIDPNADSDQPLMLQRMNAEFSVDVPVTPENLFLWSYSQMRGAARVFGSKWGMSIYGQAEPHLRLASMKLAYDLGAEFIWFWTSDHDHHVPYTEQLRLAREISAYAESRPPRDLDKLRRAATTAILIPYGYSLPTCWQLFTWGTHIYPLDRRNDHGLTYKQVLTPAVQEIARCLKSHTPYDLLPAGKAFDPNGYQRVIWVKEDGTRSVE
ncbi:MAG: hypothetical protein JW741_04325 [Sedimentisphaerales bacterium]|nr:hypothetical protein [Sedimentisphaerales bacterium]